MSMSRKEEARALAADERELVEKSHHPQVQELPDDELAKLVKLMRGRRDKARSEANRRRREMRGKAAPKGAEPSAGVAGSKAKVEALATAMRRLNGETERRRRMAQSVSMVESAQRALTMKQAAESDADDEDFNTRHAHEGMRKNASDKRRNLIRPMELGRQRKAASVAQAKRDSRG